VVPPRCRVIPSPPIARRPFNWRPGNRLAWGPGWQGTSVRPIRSLPPGLYTQLVQGVPLTGGQAQAVISSLTQPVPVLVQSASGSASSGTTVTITLSKGTTAGNCLVVGVGAVQATVPTVSTITLGGSSTNLVDAESLTGNTCDGEIWLIWNIAGGQTAVVVTFNAGSGAGQGNAAWAMEWSGILATGSPADKSNGASAISTSWSSGSSGTLSQAEELAIGVAASDATSTVLTGPGSPWTNLAQITAGGCSMITGYQVVSAATAQTYSGSQTADGGYVAVIATLKAAAPAGTAGAASVSVGPQGLGTIWYPAQVVVSTTSSIAGTDNSVCNVYLGPANVPNNLLGTVIGGGVLAAAVPPMSPGQYLTAVWTGGNPGDVASINVVGTMDALTT
jgi:hypothetical protein